MTFLFAGHAFLDLETTGLDPAVDEIIEVGIASVDEAGAVVRERWLVRPTRAVPPLVTALTGLDGRSLDGARPWSEVRPEVAVRLQGHTVVAHNASFERSFLGQMLDGLAVLDSCELTHLLFPELDSHSLDALVRWAGVREGARHRALEDAEDTLHVLEVALGRARPRGAVVAQALRLRGSPRTEDEAALQRLLAACIDVGGPVSDDASAARAMPRADTEVVRRAMRWLEAPGPVAVEAEGPNVVPAVVAASRELDLEDVVVSVPRLRGVPELVGATAVLAPGERACRSIARQVLPLLALRGADEAAAASFLWSWAHASPRLELGELSPWPLHRWPEARWMAPLLVSASGACADADCPCQDDERGAPTVLVSHATALRWLGRGVRDARVVFVDSHALPRAIAETGECVIDRALVSRLESQLRAGLGLATTTGEGAGEASPPSPGPRPVEAAPLLSAERQAQSEARLAALRASADQLVAWLESAGEGALPTSGLEPRRLRGLVREVEKDASTALAALGSSPVALAVTRAARRVVATLQRLGAVDAQAVTLAVRASGRERRLVLEPTAAARSSAASALVAGWALLVGEAPAEGATGWLAALGLSGLPVQRDPVTRPPARLHRLPAGAALELAARLGELVASSGAPTTIVLGPKLAPAAVAEALLGTLPPERHLRLHLARGRDGAHRFELKPCERPDAPATTWVFLGTFTAASLRRRFSELPPGVSEIWLPADAPSPLP